MTNDLLTSKSALPAEMDSAEERSMASKQARLDLRKRYKFMLGVGLLLAGVTLRYLVNRFPTIFQGGVADILKDVGALLVGTVAVTFIYERFIKREENELFLEDMRATLAAAQQQDKQEFLTGLRGILHDERKDSGIVVFHERPPVSAKIQVITMARTEVIEVGTALRTFVSYFTANGG